MSEAMGVAVVGAGYWGPNLVRNIQNSPRMRLRWLCDLDVERARRVIGPYSTVQTTSSLDDLLEDPDVVAVAVATPAATHADVAMRALDAGKHVLVEKPLASSSAEAVKLVDAAEERGLVLMCDHTYCYTPAVMKIRELAHAGELGDIHYVDSVRINLGLVQRDVDVLWDLAPHDLSILDFILPSGVVPEAVSAQGADPIGAGRACVAYLTLSLTGGAIAHVHVNWLSPTKIRTTIVGGSRRTLVWDDLNPTQRLAIHDRGVDLSSADNLGDQARREMMISYRSGDMVAPALVEREALASVMSEWADAISESRPARTDGRAGLRVLDVLEAASRSLEYHGATVPLRVDR
ncbi:Gfo/Idh/MocA family protein [Protofrankia symbiont of Coriaria ruscifolia]|uniref:Inositol 2-dehydrogenase n=1 Tax=Candidatus Protofrankia californiensis TaxID=1839754 RepID=A0A1C3NUY9_9ACTN|nr:Gfo/Idh/MocA family oxidoreductase [Protofrankia symbiont of Coriaria ruscifolia]SBW19254.1 Inositol 2-dehydrogenase [Candidatus Protofrankia californiensis]